MKLRVMPILMAATLVWISGVAQAQVVPTLTVEESMQAFDERHAFLLKYTAGSPIGAATVADTSRDLYSNRAMANLMLDRYAVEANGHIRRTAEWFEHASHPTMPGRDLQMEPDFAALSLANAYHLFLGTNRLEAATIQKIESFFLNNDFESIYHSENHDLLFRASRYLMAQAMPGKTFEAYGKTGSQLVAEDGQWLTEFIRFRGKQGWAEFDSPGYMATNWQTISALYNHAEDPAVQVQAHMMLDLMSVDITMDSLNGYHAGAHGRTKSAHVPNLRNGATPTLNYLYYGNVDSTQIRRGDLAAATLGSIYRPDAVLVNIALNRNEAYVNRERGHLHKEADPTGQSPHAGSIYKYTYYTPQFILGTVQKQDPYPAGASDAWYAGHEQQDWSFVVGTRPTATIFTHHPDDGRPSGSHGYWVGDTRCNCGHHFQHQSATIGLYDIRGGKGDNTLYEWIHAYVPKDSFQQLVEQDGWIFVQEGDVYGGLKLLKGYEWTTEGEWADREIISQGTRHAVVFEAGLAGDDESFEAFRQDLLDNTIEFDEEAMWLRYASTQNGLLAINAQGLRELNGQPVSFADYPLFDSPYVHSEWNSGVVEITKGDRQLLLDFNTGERIESLIPEPTAGLGLFGMALLVPRPCRGRRRSRPW